MILLRPVSGIPALPNSIFCTRIALPNYSAFLNETRLLNRPCVSFYSGGKSTQSQITSTRNDDRVNARFFRMKKLEENIYTVPNALSLSRLLLSPVIGHWILAGNYKSAFIGFTVAGFTDLVNIMELLMDIEIIAFSA